MQKLDFGEALSLILEEDPRFQRDAYHFLRDALDYTIKQRKKAREGSCIGQQVTGQQLLEGIRVFALKEFGPMVLTVFGYWGVTKCEDFGEMVFNLIRVGIFGKTDRDSIDDFKGGYSFHDAFVVPFQTPTTAVHQRIPADLPAEELN